MQKNWLASLLVAAWGLAGCVSYPPNYTAYGLGVPSAKQAYTPDAGKALVVFWFAPRPDSFGWRQPEELPASVYRIVGDGQELIGFVDYGNKVAYQSPSADQLFMVNGVPSVEFMEAHLTAGKTYYVYVNSRLSAKGFSRYWLTPFRTDPAKAYAPYFTLTPERLKRVAEACVWMEVAPKGLDWYSSQRDRIDQKRRDELKRWNARTSEDKAYQTLYKEDGL